MGNKAKWTILTYIAAHNNLDDLGERSLWQIVNVGSTQDVMHGILYDGPNGAKRYIVGDPECVLKEEALDSFDSGDPKGLVATAQWVFEQCPAERYGLVLWSHGTGWEPHEIEQVALKTHKGEALIQNEAQRSASTGGALVLFRPSLVVMLKPDEPAQRAILFDDGTGHSVDTVELGKVTQALQDAVGQPLDFLGMDACLMATAEVAYQLRDSVKILVASEELVPGHSWPYDQLYGGLRANPIWTGNSLARAAVSQYVSYYRQHPPSAGDITLVALDLAHADGLADAMDGLAEALLADMNKQAAALWAAQEAAETVEKHDRPQSKFDFHLYDLGSLTRGLSTAGAKVQAAAADLLAVLQPGSGFVLAEGHDGAWFDRTSGVSAYLMRPRKGDLSPYYSSTALAKKTHWAAMLAAYHAQYTYTGAPL